jgi:hypothetical protein
VRSRVLYEGKYGSGPIPDVAELAYTSDGRHIVVSVRGGRVVLLDPQSLEQIAEWSAGGRDGFAMAVSSDGRTIITGDDSGVTRLWEVATGKLAGSFAGHRGHLAQFAVSTDGRTLVSGGWDRVAYAWNIGPTATGRVTGAVAELRGDDATAARSAVQALAADPTGPELLKAAVKPAEGPTAEAVPGWVADLDSPAFAKRQAASQALTRAGRFAEPAVRAALAATPTAEAKERLEKIVAALPKRPSADEVFQTRAVQALELAGTESARKLLEEWANRPGGGWLAMEANGALGRLTGSR